MKEAKTIMIFANGNVAAFDDEGQIVELQSYNWINELLKYYKSQGVDVTNVKIETIINGAIKQVVVEEAEGKMKVTLQNILP